MNKQSARIEGRFNIFRSVRYMKARKQTHFYVENKHLYFSQRFLQMNSVAILIGGTVESITERKKNGLANRMTSFRIGKRGGFP